MAKEPEKITIIIAALAYATEDDARNHVKTDNRLAPGDYFIVRKSSDNKVYYVTSNLDEPGYYINMSNKDTPEGTPEKLNIPNAIMAYGSLASAQKGDLDSRFRIDPGDYYIIARYDDICWISHSPMGGVGIYISMGPNNKPKGVPTKYTVNLPLRGYHSSEEALKQREDACTISAGEYYCLWDEENGKVSYISNNPMGPGHYVLNEINNTNANKNTSDTEEGTNVDPSNTNTTTGLYDQSTNKGPLVDRDPNMTYSAGDRVEVDCFVKNLVTGTIIKFDNMPSDLSDSYSANFEPASIRGRSTAIQGYDNTEPRTVSFSTTISEDLSEEGVLTKVARLRALEYPGYTSVVEPPKCYLKLGNAVRGTFICTSVDVSYPDNAPVRDNYYLIAEVSLSFTESNDFARSAAEIEEGAGLIK